MSKKMYITLCGAEIKKLILEEKLSLDELDTAALQKLFDYETDMLCTDEGDIDTLNACAARLDELQGPLISKEEFFNIINKTAPASKRVRRLRFKKVLLVAAMIAILAVTITVTATAVDFNPFNYFKEVIGMGAGGTLNKGNITLEFQDVQKEYDTVEEALQSNDIDIWYPTVLPEGVSLKNIEFVSTASSEEIIRFVTSTPYVSVYAERKTDSHPFHSYKEEFVIEDCTFYIFDDTVTPPEYYAVCFYGDYYYCITANSYEDIILILSNLKKS
ncbi:MAG: hypothetical protein J6S77_01495 [Clostridia bacterium]|nr:hypothetical protein [Clostridia bacterium]